MIDLVNGSVSRVGVPPSPPSTPSQRHSRASFKGPYSIPGSSPGNTMLSLRLWPPKRIIPTFLACSNPVPTSEIHWITRGSWSKHSFINANTSCDKEKPPHIHPHQPNNCWPHICPWDPPVCTPHSATWLDQGPQSPAGLCPPVCSPPPPKRHIHSGFWLLLDVITHPGSARAGQWGLGSCPWFSSLNKLLGERRAGGKWVSS